MTLSKRGARFELDEWMSKHGIRDRYEITETYTVIVIIKQLAKERIPHEEQSKL